MIRGMMQMKRITRTLTVISMLLSIALSGCASVRTKIVYTVYPLGFLIERLAGDVVSYESIQENGIVQRAQIRSDYEDVLADAAVFFHIGQLEPYLTMYMPKISAATDARDLSVLNAVYDFQRYTPVAANGEVTYIEGPYYKGKAFETLDINPKDLYLWTDPIAMLSMAKDIRDWMCTFFPDDRPVFEENFSRLETDLINLDAQYQALATANITNNRSIRFVSMTASFGNWQKTYGFEVYPVVLSKYGALPDAEQLALIKERIKEDQVKYIVYEPNMTPDMVELFHDLQEELQLTRVELNNLSSLTAEDMEAGKDYLSIMYENLQVLETMAEVRETVPAADNTTEDSAEDAEPAETDDNTEEPKDQSDVG